MKIGAITVVGVLALALGNSAEAVTVFQDDLDSNTTASAAAWPDASGDYDPDNATVGSWTVREDGPEFAQVSSYTGGVPTSAHSGSNYLISGYNGLLDNTFSSQGLTTANLSTSVSQGTFDFWVWGFNDQFDVIQGRQLSGLNEKAWELTLWGGVEVKFGSNGGGGGTELSVPLNNNAWNHFVVDYDGTTQTADVTVNGTTVTSLAANPSNPAANTFDTILFRAEHTGYYDTILVTEIPEPTTATLVLLGLSGLGLYRRRRG